MGAVRFRRPQWLESGQNPRMPRARPVTMPATATHTLRSLRLPEQLRVDVALPISYEASEQPFPVVYVIDGYWFFPLVSSVVSLLEMAGEIPPVILAGIGYEPVGLSRAEELERVSNLRCRDLTPTTDTSEWWRKAGSDKPLGTGVETGHANEFLEVIEHEVKPLIRTSYRTDPHDETLAGFSLGGLFALHVLFRNTDHFDRYLAGSPALWWGEGAIFDEEEDFATRHQDLGKSLFLSIGSLEESRGGTSCNMVSNVTLLTERLRSRNYPSLQLRSFAFPNATHASAIASTFVEGLLSVFGRENR